MDYLAELEANISYDDRIIINNRVATISKEIEQWDFCDRNRFVIEGINALTATRARNRELASQSFLEKCVFNLTGKNKKMQDAINYNISCALYSAYRAIKQCAERTTLSFEMMAFINNKLNMVSDRAEEGILDLASKLKMFVRQSRNDYINAAARLDQIEQDINVLKWHSTVEYQLFQGCDYFDLGIAEKMICISNDFYTISRGKWSYSDVLLLKKALDSVGIRSRDKIIYKDIIDAVQKNNALYDRLLEKIDIAQPDECTPSLCIFQEAVKQNHCDKIAEYADSNFSIDVNTTIDSFDFVLGLIMELRILEESKKRWYAYQREQKALLEKQKHEKVLEKIKSDLRLADKYYRNGCYMEAVEICEKYECIVPDVQMDIPIRILADAYANGKGVPKNISVALEHCDFGIELNNAEFAKIAGDMCYANDMKERAYEYYTKAYSMGNSSVLYDIGWAAYKGEGCKKDYKLAEELFMQAVANGDNRGLINVGMMYEFGQGRTVDLSKAADLYLKSLEAGYTNANDRLNAVNEKRVNETKLLSYVTLFDVNYKSTGSLYSKSCIDNKKVTNFIHEFINNYGPSEYDSIESFKKYLYDSLIIYYDNTMFGSGDTGYIITREGIFANDTLVEGCFYFKDITNVSLSIGTLSNTIYFTCNGNKEEISFVSDDDVAHRIYDIVALLMNMN